MKKLFLFSLLVAAQFVVLAQQPLTYQMNDDEKARIGEIGLGFRSTEAPSITIVYDKASALYTPFASSDTIEIDQTICEGTVYNEWPFSDITEALIFPIGPKRRCRFGRTENRRGGRIWRWPWRGAR